MIETTYLKVFAYVWPVVFVLALVHYALGLWVLDTDPMFLALSYVLGATVSVMLMSHNRKSLLKISQDDPKRLAKTTTLNYLLRYLVYGVVLGFAFVNPNLTVWSVFIGLVTFKFVMVITFMVAARRDDHG